MSCDEIYELISLHIDGETTPEQEAALAAHLAECESCRALLRAYEDIQSGVTDLEVDPPERFAEGVMYRVSQEAGGSGGKMRRFAFGHATAFAAVAAALVILVGTGLVKLPNSAESADSAPEAAYDTAAQMDDAADTTATLSVDETMKAERSSDAVVTEDAEESKAQFSAPASYDALYDAVDDAAEAETAEIAGDNCADSVEAATEAPAADEQNVYRATLSGCKPEDIPELADLTQDAEDPNTYHGTAAQVREIIAAYREAYAADESDAAGVPDDAPAELTLLPE